MRRSVVIALTLTFIAGMAAVSSAGHVAAVAPLRAAMAPSGGAATVLTGPPAAIPGAVAGVAAQQPAAPRALTVDDALDMVSVSGAVMSPDGQWVLYSRRELKWDDNEYETKHWMVPAAGGDPFQYIGEEGGSSFQFSPDGRYLTFRRSVDGKQQLFWMRTAGGEAVQLTEHETSVGSYEWSEDSAKIFFSADDERPEDEAKALEDGADAIFVDEGPNGQDRDYWSNLWVFDVETKKAEKITDEKWLLGGFSVAPDASQVALTARRSNRRNDRYKDEIHVVNVTNKLVTQITDNRAPERVGPWSPDGGTFLFTAADDSEWLNRNTKIWLMDPALKEHRLLSDAFEGSPSDPVWTPDGRYLLFSGQQGTNTNLFRLDVESGEIEQLTHVEGTLRASSFSRDRSRYAYSFDDFDTPEDLYVSRVEAFEPVRLTDANPGFEERFLLADMQLAQWQSKDDFTIEGLLHLPPGWVEGNRVPLLLNIHGGPAGSFSNGFNAKYHFISGLGWAQLSPNVRGSSGYTDELREGNTVARGDGIGIGDFQDLMNGVDRVIEMGIADPERLALRGWSYGGILGGFTITQTSRFKAASIGAGVYDWTSEYGPGFNHDVRLWHIGGTPWDNAEAWRAQSALTHAANVTTATLLIHGTEDTTDTEQQSMMFFVALKDIGKAPVRYIKFPREPHGFREPRHQRIRDIEEIRWLHEHTLGEEWTPWERPGKKADEETGG